MTASLRASVALLALAASALPAAAEEIKLMAELTGAAQVPPVETEATGMADVTVDTEAMTVSWTLAYESLSGEPVAAHFHSPATPEETAPPTVDLTVDMEASVSATATATASTEEGTETTTETSTTEDPVPQDIMRGSSELSQEGLQQLRDGLWYINIHTEAHPDGEIRGQVMEDEADTAAMGAVGAMEGDAVLGGEAIRAAISGNTVQGNMLDSGAYSEFYAADGTIKGDGYTGAWAIEGDAMCFTYGEEEATCWQVRLDGEQITWLQDGADLGDGTIVPGNPNNF